MKSKLNIGITLYRPGTGLVTSNIVSFNANNYTWTCIEGIPVMVIALQSKYWIGTKSVQKY